MGFYQAALLCTAEEAEEKLKTQWEKESRWGFVKRRYHVGTCRGKDKPNAAEKGIQMGIIKQR